MPSSSRLARRLQLSCALVIALACGWATWRWPTSPWQALAGAALVLAVPSLVLALELVIARRIARTAATVPPPSPRELASAWWAEVRHFHHTFCWRQPFRWHAVPDHADPTSRGRTAVVLVHGFMCNRGFWTPWLQRLQALGHPCIAVNLEPVFASIDAYAHTIDAAVRLAVERTGRPPLVVAHSMGGLAVRAWWRRHGSAGAVLRLVTIGSPHQGTWLARWSTRPNGRQMRLRSEWLATLAAHERLQRLPPATCWYSNCDNVVFPPETATLPGADNRFVAGRAHVDLAFEPAVFAHCLQVLDQASKGCQGDSVTKLATENG